MIFRSLFIFVLFALVTCGVIGAENRVFGQNHIGETGMGDPSSRHFGMMDPATRSLGATKHLADQFREQQHRFQPNSDRRQLRTKRPEPGETEVNREGEMLLPETAREWRFRQPEAELSDRPHRPPYNPSTIELPGKATPGR